jgi:PAS domain S-box-containing protein
MTARVRVLHVDDDPEFAELAARFLQRHDEAFDVATETTVDDALARLREEPVDCVVADYALPGTDGMALLDTIRAEWPRLPFIFFTGRGSEEIASEALSRGATDYLQKQSGTEQYELLANRIRNAVDQRRADERAAKLDRIRTLVREVNQALVRAETPEEVESSVCELIADASPDRAACIAGVDEATMRIEPRTWAGADESYFEELDMVIEPGEPGREAPGGRAYHDRELAVSQDIAEDDRYEKWREPATERGFRSLAVAPLDHEGTLYGLLAVFADRPDAFDEAEREMLTELGDDIAHALHARATRTELRRLTDEFRTVFEQAPGGLLFIEHDDGTFRYRRCNRRMEELSGMSADDLRDRTPREAFGETDGATVEATYRDCIERGEAVDYREEFEIDGETRVRSGTVAPVTTDGETDWLVTVVTDVTDAHRRREQLAFQRSLLDAQQEAMDIGILVVDEEGRISSYNERLLELWGADESPLEAPTIEAVRSWAAERVTDPETFVETIQGRYDSPDAVVRDDVELADGRVLDRYTAPVTVDDEFAGRLWTFRDVTAQHEREARLEAANARLDALFENSPDMIVIHDADGVIRDANRRFCEALGYPESEIVGKRVDDVDVTVDIEAARSFWTELPMNTPRRFEGRLRRQDGTTFPVEIHLTRLDLDGEDRFVAIDRDISDRVERERELVRRNERLDEFAGVISHDLRNPLQVAQGRLELLGEETESEHLDAADRALDRMAALIDDLLTLTREGNEVGEVEPVETAAVARRAWQGVETGDASLVVDAERSIAADESRLRQLLENLFRNSIEHGSTGSQPGSDDAAGRPGDGPTVTVGDLQDGFFVADDGPGIPPEEREAVFDPGVSSVADNTGFGLAIVKQIAEAHGWTVTVTESDAGGARFEFTGVETP